MKKLKFIFKLIILIVIFISFGNISLAEENTTDEILESQKDSLNIGGFLEESEKYTEDIYGDINIEDIFNSAITGNIDNKQLLNNILSIVGKEILSCVSVLGSVIVVIVIHSILRSISDGLQNENVSKIVYYVQYILIVTLIMTNFAEIINMVKTSIEQLVGFMNSLIPILITLMLTTGSFTSVGILEPILLFLITFIGNIINMIVIPIILVSTALAIISKISERVQLDKLSKFFNSSIVCTSLKH